MRLSKEQKELIISALTPYISSYKSELRLYGSRVNDNLKGGDIDLLLILEDKEAQTAVLERKHYILSDIKKNIGDQKIDLTITNFAETKTDPFLKSILPTSVLLEP